MAHTQDLYAGLHREIRALNPERTYPERGPILDTPEPCQVLRLEMAPDVDAGPTPYWSGLVLADRGPEVFDRYVVWTVWSSDARVWVCHSGFYTDQLPEATSEYQNRRTRL